MDGHLRPRTSRSSADGRRGRLRPVTRLPLRDASHDLGPRTSTSSVQPRPGADACRVPTGEGNAQFCTKALVRAREQRWASSACGVSDQAAATSGGPVLEEILPEVDQVLVMTVDPGFGHQQFIAATLPKIRRVREMIERARPGCDLEVDGGHRRDDGAARRRARARTCSWREPRVFGARRRRGGRDEAAAGRPRSQRRVNQESMMQLGMIGLGRMGANMVRRLHRGRPRVRGLRRVPEGGGGAREGEGGRRVVARGFREEAREAARGLADGARPRSSTRRSPTCCRCSSRATS